MSNTVTVALKYSSGIHLQVSNDERIIAINGFMKGITDEHGFALTRDVPADLWEKWHAEFKEHSLVKNGLIFAHKEEKSVQAEAKEKRATRSKTEQMPKMNEDGTLDGKE